MSELTCLELSVLPWATQLPAQAGMSQLAFPLPWLFSARDKPAAPQGVGVWPTIWILAGIIYLPLCLFNFIYVRLVVWGISLLAALMMLARLAWS